MTEFLEDLLARIKQSDGRKALSRQQQESIQFFANPVGSIDDVADNVLEDHLAAVGGSEVAGMLRFHALLIQREFATQTIFNWFQELCAKNPPQALVPVSEEFFVRCRGLFQFVAEQEDREVEALQRLTVYESLGDAHQRFLLDVAAGTPRVPTGTGTDTTQLASEQSTLFMAVHHPEWIVHRNERLELLQEFDAPLARIYRMAEYAGCDPVELAHLLQTEEPTGDWSVDRVENELATAEAFCKDHSNGSSN